MPSDGRRILKFDPQDDSMICVGDDLGEERGRMSYNGTLVSSDSRIYGIFGGSRHVVIFNPMNDTTTFLTGTGVRGYGLIRGNGVVGRDGNIYQVSNKERVIKFDFTNHTFGPAGNVIMFDDDVLVLRRKLRNDFNWWGDPIVGNDGCIYWPPKDCNRVLKYDPEFKYASLVGDDFMYFRDKWFGGALGPGGAIYCLPSSGTQVLVIDLFKEFAMELKVAIKEYPENLGFLFQNMTNEDRTLCETAIAKYGRDKTFQLIDKCISRDEACTATGLRAFMVVASCEYGTVDAVYSLLRRNPSLVI